MPNKYTNKTCVNDVFNILVNEFENIFIKNTIILVAGII